RVTPHHLLLRATAGAERDRPRRDGPSCRGRTSQLSLEGGDVSPAESPLPAALEGRQDALARELVDRVGTEVEHLGDLFAVHQHVFLVLHGPTGTTRNGTGRSRGMRGGQGTTFSLCSPWVELLDRSRGRAPPVLHEEHHRAGDVD